MAVAAIQTERGGRAAGRPMPRARTAARIVVPAKDRWMITGFLAAIAMPPEAQFNLGPLVLSPQRVLLMLALFPAVLRVIGDRRLGLRMLDGLAGLHVLWAWISVCKVHGINSMSIEAGGSYTIEFLGSYMLGRALIASPAHAVFFARRLLLFIFVIALAAVPEMLTGKHLIREAFGSVFGSRYLGGVTPRFGLTRAFASFDHPILWGVFAASALGMTWYLTRARYLLSFRRLWRCVAIVGAAFTSLSTGPLMACTVQIGILGWDVVTKGIKGRWWILLAGAVAAYIAIDALSNRDPLTVFVHYLTFNAQTGYDRKLIWDIGLAQVKLTPLFGIGFNPWTTAPEWWHNTSVDAFWLLTALRYGVPGALTLVALTLWAIVRMIRVPYKPLRPIVMGWLVTFIGLSIAAVTVHLWGSAFVLFGFLLGMGVSVSGLRPPRPRGAPPQTAPSARVLDERQPVAATAPYISENIL